MWGVMVVAIMAAGPPTDQGIPKGARLHVLLVAIDIFNSRFMTDLDCSVGSANGIATALALQKKLYADISIRKLYNKDATRSAIKRELDALSKAIRPDDRCVILFSGHGIVESTKNDEGETIYVDKKPILIPHSYIYHCVNYSPKLPETHFTARNFYDSLAKFNGHVLLLLDACNCGALPIVYSDPARRRDIGLARLAIITSCELGQECLEPAEATKKVEFVSRSGREYKSHDDLGSCSFFAVAVIKALREGSRPVTPRTLFDKVRTGQEAALAAAGVKKGGRYEERIYSPTARLPFGSDWQPARLPLK